MLCIVQTIRKYVCIPCCGWSFTTENRLKHVTKGLVEGLVWLNNSHGKFSHLR